ncbi:class I SAM-dependent methyltransferase [Polyangium sorediatum]
MSAADLFNGFVGANVIRALQHLDVLDALDPVVPADVDALSRAAGVAAERITPLLAAATSLGILAPRGGGYVLTSTGVDVRQHVGFFIWAVGGYGRMFAELGALARSSEPRPMDLIDRGDVALGSDLCNTRLMRQTILDAFVAQDFSMMVDLGCGNAGRLIDICTAKAGVRGIGFDLSAVAVALAKNNVAARGLSDRVGVHQANVLDMQQLEELAPEIRKADLVTSFMMLHDLFNAAPPAVVLQGIRRGFPAARRFLFADTFRMPEGEAGVRPPIFNLGFQLTHSVMALDLFTPALYREAFEAADMRLRQQIALGVPNTYLFVVDAA